MIVRVSGRLEIARRFSAGVEYTKDVKAREAGDRFLPPASRAILFSAVGPSDLSLGYSQPSAGAD